MAARAAFLVALPFAAAAGDALVGTSPVENVSYVGTAIYVSAHLELAPEGPLAARLRGGGGGGGGVA